MITSLLFILLYALVALLVLFIVFYIVEKFLPIPAQVRQILYGIVGVLILIQIVALFTGGPVISLPRLR